jgi:hypothetical protein
MAFKCNGMLPVERFLAETWDYKLLEASEGNSQGKDGEGMDDQEG